MFPEGTKPLPEPTLTNPPWGIHLKEMEISLEMLKIFILDVS